MANSTGVGTVVATAVTTHDFTAIAQKSVKPSEDVQYRREGRQIVLPAEPSPMSIADAEKHLKRLREAEESKVQVQEVIPGTFPLEGAYYFMRAMREAFGWATAIPSGFFKTPPHLVSLEVAFGKFEQVIWGDFQVPGIEDGHLACTYASHEGRMCFAIGGTIKRKYEAAVKELAEITRRISRDQNIYRGQAVRFAEDAYDEDFPKAPTFLDLSQARPDELIFSDRVAAAINANLFTPIERTALARQMGVPLKRGVLLEGRYGGGKTLTAFVTAKKCVENGWTFLMLHDSGQIAFGIETAKLYQPAVVFAEDIDRQLAGERDQDMDDILNTIDGIGVKGADIMVVLTTNNVEKMHRAMLRPGRLDAIITITPPDAIAAQKLLRLYARDRLPADADLTEAGELLAGQIPAVIREAVERAKLYTLSRSDGISLPVLSGADLSLAAVDMRPHLDMMAAEPPSKETVAERIGNAFIDAVKHAVDDSEAADRAAGARSMAGAASHHAAKAAYRAEIAAKNSAHNRTALDEHIGPQVAAIAKKAGVSAA